MISADEARAIRRLIARLPRAHRVRGWAEYVLQGGRLEEHFISRLMHEVNSKNLAHWRSQEAAAWTLGRARMEPEMQEAAAIELQRALTRTAGMDGNVSLRCLMRLMAAGGILSLLLCWQSGDLSALGCWLLMVVLLAPLIWPASLMWEDSRVNRVRAAAATALGHIGRPQSATALTEAAFDAPGMQQTVGCFKVREAASAVLAGVLLKLTPEHYGQLGSALVPNLCRLLYHPEDTIVLSSLTALEMVGDGRAVALVERVAEKGRNEAIRAEARRVLPVLLERQRQENDPHILLRATQSPTAPPDVLLRPAVSQPETAPEQLLRPSATETP